MTSYIRLHPLDVSQLAIVLTIKLNIALALDFGLTHYQLCSPPQLHRAFSVSRLIVLGYLQQASLLFTSFPTELAIS